MLKRGTSGGTRFVVSVFGRVALVATAIFAIFASAPSFAADWTDASGNEYTALKYIKGEGSSTSGGPYIITDVSPNCTDTVKLRCKLARIDGNECFFCSRATSGKSTNDKAFTCFRITSNIRVQRTSAVQAESSAVFIEAGSEYSISVDFNNGSSTTDAVKINGDGVTMNKVLGTTDYTPTKMVIFASHSAGDSVSSSSSFGNKGSYYLYNLQIYSSAGALNHNFMPAKNASDVAGLYDTVTETFYGPTGPSGSTAFTVGEWGGDRAGKRWTGAGGDNKMSTAANWQGGVAPVAGDDIDFTIAAPFAEIEADIDATFGKIYLGTGDLPAFTGSLASTAINDLARMQAYDTATDGFTFTLEAPSGQDFTWSGGAAANWGDSGVWTYNGEASDWYDNNNAILSTADATATLAADVTADSLAFNADATIGGSSTLTAPTVSVASGVSATISSPTAGALAKTGAGTLTLTQNRADATTVTAGTLKMDGATVSALTLGTDGGAPVVFDYGGQVLQMAPEDFLVTGSEVTLTNGTFQVTYRTMQIRDSTKIPSRLTIAKGATLRQSGTYYVSVDKDNGTATINIDGGTFEKTTGEQSLHLQHAALNGTMRINVLNGGRMSFTGSVDALCNGNVGTTPSLYMAFSDSTFYAGKNFRFASYTDTVSTSATGVFAATNSAIVVDTFNVGRNKHDDKSGGSLTADFENCVVTARFFAVYYDRPLNNARFNGTRLAFPTTGTIEDSDGAGNWITVGDDGLTLDTQAYAVALNANLGGSGAVTKAGAGTLTVNSNQTSTAALNVHEGALAVNGGVSIARPVSVAGGATLTIKATDTATLDTLMLAGGSTLNIASYSTRTPLAVATSATLPENGTVALMLDGGAFPQGVYAICSAAGLRAADGAKFAPLAGGETVAWSVSGDTLILTVGEVSENYWTGLAGDGRMSTAGNWLNGVPAEGADIDFSVVSSATTIIADTGRTFGAVTMGAGVITFTNAMAATSFSDTSKISVGADSTVTVDGDLVFSGSVNEYIVNAVAAGGTFRVTGDIIADVGKTQYVLPCVSASIDGTIEAKGLVNNSSGGGEFWFARNRAGSHVNWAIGADGIGGTARMGYLSNASDLTFSATITATADFTVSTEIVNTRTLTLNPAGHTIALGTDTSASAGAIIGGNVPSLVIAGSGKVVASYDISTWTNNNAFTVSDGATFALTPGTDLGTGMVTVEDGGTLEVAASGTVTLNGGLTLDDGATLAFNFTDRSTVSTLALAEGKSVVFTEGASTNIAVKVSGVRPKGGAHALTSCGGFGAEGVSVSLAVDAPEWVKGVSVDADGNIVLDVKPRGTMIIVR